MRVNTPGITIPEERFNPLPFYHRSQSPVVYRWDQFCWNKPDPMQRWFYTNFTGRTHASIWRQEQNRQIDGSTTAVSAEGDWSDTRAWTLPNIVLTGNTMQSAPYDNYIDLANNVRPTNMYTGRIAGTTADELYIAPRITGDRMAMRFDARLPAAVNMTTNSVNYHIGWEVNSQGGGNIASLYMYTTGGVGHARLLYRGYGFNNQAGGVNQISSADIAILHPDHFCEYYLEWDPPVIRFWQPRAGQTSAGLYPDTPIELSCPSLPVNHVMQPFTCNESDFITTGAGYEFRLGSWAIWQLHRQSNTYQVNTRNCASTPCGCSAYTAVFDTGGRPYVHINLENGCGCVYYVEHAETGLSQLAGNPEAQTWRPIDGAYYTGATCSTTGGRKGISFLNASRFIRVRMADVCPRDNNLTETIAFTANGNE